MNSVYTKTYIAPPVNLREVLRYIGAKQTSAVLDEMIRECLIEAEKKLIYKICYTEVDLSIGENILLADTVICSEDLKKNLSGCDRAVIFAATVGLELDRLIAKYSRLSPARALMLQAVGTERIEALCDAFCAELARKHRTTARFSPGYGDLPLSCQTDLFAVLDCERKLGLTLTDTLLMLPTKSVTAIIGIGQR